MRLRFWRTEEKQTPKESEKERLLRHRATLLEASYNLRLLDKMVSTRYFANTPDSPKVKGMIWDMTWKGQLDTYGKIWVEVAEIEEILRTKYHVDFLNAGHLEDIRLDLLSSNIKRAEYDRPMPTMQQGQPAVN